MIIDIRARRLGECTHCCHKVRVRCEESIGGKEDTAGMVHVACVRRELSGVRDNLSDPALAPDGDKRLPRDITIDLVCRKEHRHGSDAFAVQDSYRGVCRLCRLGAAGCYQYKGDRNECDHCKPHRFHAGNVVPAL